MTFKDWFKRNYFDPATMVPVQTGNVAVLDGPTLREAPLPQPQTVYNLSGMNAEEREDYLAVADSIGMQNTPAVLSERVRAFLIEENIRVYDPEQVCEYLDSKLGQGQWEWKGLREKDVNEFKGWIAHMGRYRVPFGDKVYGEAIPYPVLLTLSKISEVFPDYNFFVSARKDEKGDPFIRMTSKIGRAFIVERWDEPGYRER